MECLNRPAVFDKFKLPMFAKTKLSMSNILALNTLSHALSSARIAAHVSECALFIGFFTSENYLYRTGAVLSLS